MSEAGESRIWHRALTTRSVSNDGARKLNDQPGLTRSERFLFEQVARTQYLVGLGFQMLADDKLEHRRVEEAPCLHQEKDRCHY
jgi:hypothetical protein